MVTYYKKTIKDKKLTINEEYSNGCWIYLENPSASEIEFVSDRYNLDELLLNDALDPFEVPRMEFEDKKIYLFTRIPHKDNNSIVSFPILLTFSNDFIGTVSDFPLPFLNKLINGEIEGFNTTQKTKFIIEFIKEITYIYNRYIIEINREVRKISGHPYKINEKDILDFVVFEETLNTFISDLVPTKTLVNNLLSGKYIRLFEEDKDLVEDILLSIDQIIETCKSNLKTIVNIREAYSTIVTNNLNRVIKILTVLTIVITIPNVIAGVFGMNVYIPASQSQNSFWFILSFILFSSLLILILFKWKKWL